MKKVLQCLCDYQKKHADWKVYLSIVAFLTICIILNYRFDFEDSYIDAYNGKPVKWVWMFLFHAVPYLVVCFILYAFNKNRVWLTSKDFWLKLFVGFGLLALDRSFYGFNFLFKFLDPADFLFVLRCISWSSSLILVVIPMLLLYNFMEKDSPKIWYGLSWKKFDPKPYLILLAISAVFIGVGSFLSENQDFYPRYQHAGAASFIKNHNTSDWMTTTLFEICYGSNFISVELIFRGFLIFAFTRTLGSYAVLPMIVTYAFLHFGKPLSETISSVFGGYVLGIISYNSRNIWGGVFVHLGVAWLMELFGWLQGMRG